MPAYKAHFKPVGPLQLEFFGNEDDKPIGTLKIKPSTIQWKPKGKHQDSRRYLLPNSPTGSSPMGKK